MINLSFRTTFFLQRTRPAASMFSPLIPVMVRTKREDMLASIVLSQSVIFFMEGEKNGVKSWSVLCLIRAPQNPSLPSYQMEQGHNKTI